MIKQEQMSEKIEKRKGKDYKPSMIETIRSRLGGSMSNLTASTPEKKSNYSSIINGNNSPKGNISTVQRRIEKKFIKTANHEDDDFKVGSSLIHV